MYFYLFVIIYDKYKLFIFYIDLFIKKLLNLKFNLFHIFQFNIIHDV